MEAYSERVANKNIGLFAKELGLDQLIEIRRDSGSDVVNASEHLYGYSLECEEKRMTVAMHGYADVRVSDIYIDRWLYHYQEAIVKVKDALLGHDTNAVSSEDTQTIQGPEAQS